MRPMNNAASSRPVLILGASARVVVPLARALERQCGVPVEVAAMSPRDQKLHSRSIRAFTSLPDFHRAREAFDRELWKLVRERKFDMIVPVQDAALLAIAENYERLAGLATLACPPPHVIERVLDKRATLRAAQQCGVPIPKTISSTSELESMGADLRYPVVVKPAGRREASTFKALYFFEREDLLAWVEEKQHEPWLIQEYCPGEGVGIEMLMHRGQCLARFQHRRLKESPPSGGVAVLAVAEAPDQGLVEASERLLRMLEWEGVAMVEFRQNPADGTAILMEVNGRFWGTTSLALGAGLAFPVYQWKLLHGLEPAIPQGYQVGFRWRWTAGCVERTDRLLASPGLAPRQESRWLAIPALVWDCLNPGVHDALWSFSDPLPALYELAVTLRGLLKANLKALLRGLLPASWVQEMKQYRSFTRKERSIYLRWKLQRYLGKARERERRVPPGARSFLFVCHGNIMRSPLCAALLDKELTRLGAPEMRVRSAGLHAKEGGSVDPRALVAAQELEVSLAHHRAKVLTADMVDEADVVFVMDSKNLVQLLARHPSARPKLVMMSCYADSCYQKLDIQDPYSGDLDETRSCYKLLSRCIRNLALSIGPNVPERPENQGSRELCPATGASGEVIRR